jgi:hypothetical protein
MAHDHHAEEPKRGLWYTYFGETGAAAVAFIWILLAILWIFGVVNLG